MLLNQHLILEYKDILLEKEYGFTYMLQE